MSASARLGYSERAALITKNESLSRENERLKEKLNEKDTTSNTTKLVVGVLAVTAGSAAGYLIGSPTAVPAIDAFIRVTIPVFVQGIVEKLKGSVKPNP